MADVYQDIQSQNDFSTTQLSVMGYKGDALKVQFREDTIRERQATATVMVPQTREPPRGYCPANTHGKKFFVTGGEHVTSDDMFKVAEINRRTVEAAERKKDKKGRVDYHHRHEAALPILNRLENELENNLGRRLTSKELEALLRWKGVSVSKMGNVVNRRILYQQFAEGGSEEVSIPAPWRENDQVELDALRNAPIEMADISYGRFLAQQKRDPAERAYQKMSDKEKVDFKWKMTEIDVAGTNDVQSVSSSLTPV